MNIEELSILKKIKDSSESEEIKDLSFESHKNSLNGLKDEKSKLLEILTNLMINDKDLLIWIRCDGLL